MHNISNLFYFVTTLYTFRAASPSVIRYLRLYIQHHTIQVLWLLASKQPQNLYDICLILYVQS
jgi:putative flippase GtrA